MARNLTFTTVSPNFDQYTEFIFSRTEGTHGLQQNLLDGDACYKDMAERGIQLLGERRGAVSGQLEGA